MLFLFFIILSLERILTMSKKRREERNIIRQQKTLYTYEELLRYIQIAMDDAKKKYNVRYTMCLATTLSAPPFNFGKKRVCEVVKLFFDQIEGIQLGTIDDKQIEDEARKLGITTQYIDGQFVVDVDSRPKNMQNVEIENKVYIGGNNEKRR